MLKPDKRCAVCKFIKNQPKGKALLERIYDTTHYNPTGTESLRKLQSQHKGDFSYPSLLNHVKKHQFLTESDFDKARMNKMAAKSEQAIAEKVIGHQSARDLVLEKGYEQIESGEMKITTNNVLTAARDTMNYESKKVDQQLQMMEMVFHYSSGEATSPKGNNFIDSEVIDGEPTTEIAGSSSSGEGQSDNIHSGITRNAAPPRPDYVPETHPGE